MADVFVSYKAEDRRRVEPLVRALEAEGFSVWWDAQISGGEQWRETILDNLESAQCVVVIWSRRSIGRDGEFVRDEATRAKRRGTYLPVRLDDVEPPLGFGETQALSLQGWKGDVNSGKFRAILASVRSRVGDDRPPGRSVPVTSVSRRGALLAGAGVALVAVGSTALWRWSSGNSPAPKSIAVLPFANLSGDPAQAYFSDGIAEELRSALARIPGLKVVARTSSEAVREDDAKTAARKLNVANILTGSVRRSPAIVRISSQLIDGRDGTERWSQDYDRPAGDALAIQSDIAGRVASALALQLALSPLTLGGTLNPEAHDYFLKGLAFRQSQHTAENMQRAIALFDEAIRLDPRYADAYALKASALAELSSGFANSGDEMRSWRDEATDTANRALALSPNLPTAHAALANVATGELHFAKALAEFRSAAAARPDAVILGQYGLFVAMVGLTEEAHRIGRRVVTLDPLNGRSYVPDAQAFFSARSYREAIEATRKILAFSPGAPAALSQLGASLLLLGKLNEARAIFERMPADDLFRLTNIGILDARTGNHPAAQQAAEIIERTFGSAASYQLAQLQAQRGDPDAAFAALARAVDLPDPGIISLLVDAFVDPLRGDPRFRAIRSKIEFPPGVPAQTS